MSPYGYGADKQLTRQGLQDPEKAMKQGEQAAARQRAQEHARQAARAFADLRQFPREGPFTHLARKKGVPPWERESLTYTERRNGSIFGAGLVDKSWETSEGEKRAFKAFAHNNVRAAVREWMDEGKTDEQIADLLRGFQPKPPTDPFLADLANRLGITGEGGIATVPPDIRRRFGV